MRAFHPESRSPRPFLTARWENVLLLEVNLRFYVKRVTAEGTRRGVVFIREILPRRLVALIARALYNEPYLALPMWRQADVDATAGGSLTYSWSHRGAAHALGARVVGPAAPPPEGSEAEFITEHYWGYNRQRGGDTLEYRVEHPRWSVWTCAEAEYRCPRDSDLYGGALRGSARRRARIRFPRRGKRRRGPPRDENLGPRGLEARQITNRRCGP